MADVSQGEGWWLASDGRWYPPQPAMPPPPLPASYVGNRGPLGKRENVWLQFLWSVLTLGFYGIYWAYKCHQEVKDHTGDGVGGAAGAVIYFFVGIVTLFLLPVEIERMYKLDGRPSPVSAWTALWALLIFPWYFVCQNALNEYWASKGAPPP